jgi:putative transposase
MTLVEQIVIKRGHKLFAKLDNLCLLSKNLYNATLYLVRQHFFETGKYLSYGEVNKIMRESKNPEYYAMNTKVSQHTQKLVDNSFKSFFALRRKYLKNPKSLSGEPHIPHYLKKDGRQSVFFTNQAITTPKEGYMKLSGIDDLIPVSVEKIQFARLTHKGTSIVIEVGYHKETKAYVDNGRTAAIDLGVSNLATLTFQDSAPIIFNGKPVKSINQFFNKRLAELKSKQSKTKSPYRTTARMTRLSEKRFNRIKDYMHKTSREIVNQLVSHNVTNLVIGYNKGWKQDANTGKVNNQKFVQIPFTMLISMIQYKCELAGIKVETVCESHTSKCSFLDKEKIGHHSKYIGRRVHRGLFKASNGQTINADVNGSLNIMRRFLDVVRNTDIYNTVNLIEACSTPSVFTVKR